MKKMSTIKYQQSFRDQVGLERPDEGITGLPSGAWPPVEEFKIEITDIRLPDSELDILIEATLKYNPPHAASYQDETEEGNILDVQYHAFNEQMQDVFIQLSIQDQSFIERISEDKINTWINERETVYWADTIG